ncbi:unnamed protein product, partial [Cyprideis torosa]
MPEKDGFEVCQTLKNDERTSHIPIILLTAKIDVASRLEGLGVGADAYLSKPFLKEELLIRLDKMLELRQTLQARYLAGSAKPIAPGSEGIRSALSMEDVFLQKIYEEVEKNLSDVDFGNVHLARAMHL